jgi:23S rRNA (guanosine2251-2'-O)-methyltransferase
MYGYHSIEEALKRGVKGGTLLYSSEKGRRGDIIELAKKKKVQLKQVEEKELDRYYSRKKHRGLILLCEKKQKWKKRELSSYSNVFKKENALILVLDSITDPHNYGAILRSADQFEVDLVIIPERKSVKETDIVSITSAGASSYINQVTVPNVSRALDFLKGKNFWVYGADMDGTAAHRCELKGKIVLVMGSEGKGIRALVKEKCDIHIKIPVRGHIDSLNVSVATGILLYEIRRQQKLLNL